MNFFYKIILVVILLTGCKTDNLKVTFEKLSLSTSWKYDTTKYYIMKEGYEEYIAVNETINKANIKIIERYTCNIATDLYAQKIITSDNLSKLKEKEELIYHKKINEDVESTITLNHDNNSNQYSGYLTDTILTEIRMKRNSQKVDSITQNVPKGWEICGTALLAVYQEGVPRFRRPVSITPQTIDSILKSWKRE